MLRTTSPGSSAGQFLDRSLPLVPGTLVTAKDRNDVQEEICNVIESVEALADVDDQLLGAIDAKDAVVQANVETVQDNLDALETAIESQLSGRLGVFRRQSILSGNVDSDGFANFLSASGLNVSIDATPTPIRLAFAAGSDSEGAIDYIEEISADVSNAWTLPATPAISGNVTRSSQTVTVNTASAHGMTTGDYAYLNATDGDYLGERPVTVSDSDTVTMTLAGTAAPASPAGSPVFNRAFFLYVDRNVSTGALTYGYVTTPPVYGVKYPSAPVTGQHFFNFNDWKMYVWDGAAWDEVQRIFIGDAWTSTASMTLRTWPLLGGYQGAAYNTTTGNADDTSSFGWGVEGGVVPSVATSAKDKVVKVGPLREGQQVVLQTNYLAANRNYSYSRTAWSNVNFNDDSIGGITIQNIYAPDGTCHLTFSGAGFLNVAWSTLAGRGMRYRLIVAPNPNWR